MVIKRVGVWSVARVYGALLGGMGLLIGLVVAALSAVGMTLAEGDEPGMVAAAMGVGAVVILPIFYGVLGICTGAIGGALYNVVAGVVGGVSIDVE